MFLEVNGLLQPAEVKTLRTITNEIAFIDGRASNPANIAKQNLQASHNPNDDKYLESSRIVMAAFMRSAEFRAFALPKKMAPPVLARYRPGMKYGPHADAAVLHLPNGTQLRSDLSATVFLGDPAQYDGGELIVHLGTKPVAFKGAPGDAIIYPSTTLHEVRPVTAGERLVSITFIESLIPDEFLRTQLFELNDVAEREGHTMSWESRVRLDGVRQNLMRLWSESP